VVLFEEDVFVGEELAVQRQQGPAHGARVRADTAAE
jgi:hypothetical protein